jgi:crossover junction endodeoxyribonuclease RuvC
MAALRIIGIDPGLRHTGWGIIESDGPRLGFVACGTISSEAAGDLAVRLRQLFEGLNAALSAFAPDEAAAEESFVNKDARATLKLGQARGIALLAPALSGISVAEYAPTLVKKSVVGNGHGGKEQIRAMIRHLLPRAEPDSEHAADALAIAITHAHHRTAIVARIARGELSRVAR